MRSNKGGLSRGASREHANAYEESIYRAIMGPDGKTLKDAYTTMLRDLMIDPNDVLER